MCAQKFSEVYLKLYCVRLIGEISVKGHSKNASLYLVDRFVKATFHISRYCSVKYVSSVMAVVILMFLLCLFQCHVRQS